MKLTFVPAQGKQSREQMIAEGIAAGFPREQVENAVDNVLATELFLDTTNTYQVNKGRAQHGLGPGVELWHLMIKRVDREPIHDWRVFQAIKNAILGEECEAVELYPAESRLVDGANSYHLFGFGQPYPQFSFPFGFTERMVVDDPGIPRAKQRPRG